jgi:hypothetical protein
MADGLAVGTCVCVLPKRVLAASNTGSSRHVVVVLPRATKIYRQPRRYRLVLTGPLRATQGGDAAAEACFATLT